MVGKTRDHEDLPSLYTKSYQLDQWPRRGAFERKTVLANMLLRGGASNSQCREPAEENMTLCYRVARPHGDRRRGGEGDEFISRRYQV